MATAGDWPGQYTNGVLTLVLQAQQGSLVAIPTGQPLTLTHHSTDLYFATRDGRPFFPIRLIRDGAGRRYVVLDDLAYIHDEDRPVH